jgi:hypothetical protein
LWDSDAVIDKLQETYDRLPADVQAEIPLERVWTLLPEDDQERPAREPSELNPKSVSHTNPVRRRTGRYHADLWSPLVASSEAV